MTSLFLACSTKTKTSIQLLPIPHSVEHKAGFVELKDGFSIETNQVLQPLTPVFDNDFFMISGIRNSETGKSTSIKLYLNDDLEKEAYTLLVDQGIIIEGGSYAAVSMGLTSVLQLMNDDFSVPKLKLKDQPDVAYRSLMLDLARGWHDMGVLKEIIALCKWYKINYLHLHLTDDSSFTFPSTKYPKLATKGRSFTVDELKRLNEYAHERGVTLVPEIDVPGHSTEFVKKMPELFGIGDPRKNSYTISMSKEEVYEALNTIIGEVSEIFTYSPYIHIGGDEAFFTGMEDDPETIAYMKKNNIPSLNELFRHFLVRMNDIVKANGKQTMVWAGFKEKGEIEIPRDIIVILWHHQYYNQQRLVDDGFQVINASFKPLYVVNNRKWDADYIYTNWNLKRWEGWGSTEDFNGTEVSDPNNQLMGATLCVWEQNQINQVHRLRERLPAMAERLWKPNESDLIDFRSRLTSTDKKLKKLLRPFEITLSGKTYPDMIEGNFYEHLWFNKNIELTATTSLDNITLRYTTDGNDVSINSPVFNNTLQLSETRTVKIQAFDNENSPVGQPFHQRYFLRPITVKTNKLWKELPPGSWEKLRFEGEMTVSLETSFKNYSLHYTIDNSVPKPSSPIYEDPITIDKTTQVRAQLFDGEGKAFGSGFSETYYIIINEPSLTTGKPIFATNEHITPGATKKANNGRITLWEMWGGHVGEEVWIQVDLEKVEEVSRFKVYNFWDNYRYYQYTITGSIDGENWTELVDFSENTEKASINGYEHKITPASARYLRINLLYNSANPGLHLVEFNAFE